MNKKIIAKELLMIAKDLTAKYIANDEIMEQVDQFQSKFEKIANKLDICTTFFYVDGKVCKSGISFIGTNLIPTDKLRGIGEQLSKLIFDMEDARKSIQDQINYEVKNQ